MSPAHPAQRPSAGAADDSNNYDAILGAVMETARGRWFIAELNRRNRHAETERVMQALRRIERRLAAEAGRAPPHPDVADLAAIFGLPPRDDVTGLTGGAVAEMARELGARADAMRDAVLSARGALRGLMDGAADARLCGALDRAMVAIDGLAQAQGAAGRRMEGLADVVSSIRERVATLIETGAAPQGVARPAALAQDSPPAGAAPLETPVETPEPEIGEDDIFADAPTTTAFQNGLPIAPIGAGARLRLAIADEERALRDLASGSGRAAPADDPQSLSDLDRLSYEQRYALFAS